MSRVDWITWKTNKNEIINPENIISNISEKYNDYDIFINSVIYNNLNLEIEKGGLDKFSLNIMGISPVNASALNIINKIDEIKDLVSNLKEKISENIVEQKEIEKEQLISAIEEKISEEEKILNDSLAIKNGLVNKSDVSIGELDDIIDITNERIVNLKERLEMAKSL